MSISRKRQYQLLTENGGEEMTDYTQVDHLPTHGKRVVFQGVEGAYSFGAMKEFFDDTITSFHVDTWKEAMEAITRGEADYAVLPIENSTAGIVSDIYDLLVEYPHYIVGEQELPVEHVLMALPGAKAEEIRTVISHPQALAQCRRFLDSNETGRRKSVSIQPPLQKKYPRAVILRWQPSEVRTLQSISDCRSLKEGILMPREIRHALLSFLGRNAL